MTYKKNPKLEGSGMLGCIPQRGACHINCQDCFYNGGRSFLEPLLENTPNMPEFHESIGKVIRINDGNDSNINRELVIESTRKYAMKFYNTSIPELFQFHAPVVLTLNPGKMTDKDFYKLDPIPKNLMFVRVRVNTWNIDNVVIPAVKYYTDKEVPVVLTFLAYFAQKIPLSNKKNYMFRKRTLNSYNAITTKAWEFIMNLFKYNKYVDSCGKIEGELGDTHCRFCGNCLKHFYACLEKLRS